MKNFSNNTKCFIFCLTFIIASFTLAESAHADTYVQDCLDGGSISSIVNVGPPYSPYPAASPTPFSVSASITSTCSNRIVSLTAENNWGPILDIIPRQIIFQGSIIGPFFSTPGDFVSPYGAGSYVVHFITFIEELLPITGFPVDARYGCGAPVVTYYSAYPPSNNDIEPGMDLWLDPQMQNVLPQGNYIQSVLDGTHAYTLINGHYIDSNGIHSTMVGDVIWAC